MKFVLKKIYIYVKCKYFFLGSNLFSFSDRKDFLKLLAWKPKYSQQAGEQTAARKRQAARKRDEDMRGVRPPDGLMTTGHITAGSCAPTQMTPAINVPRNDPVWTNACPAVCVCACGTLLARSRSLRIYSAIAKGKVWRPFALYPVTIKPQLRGFRQVNVRN